MISLRAIASFAALIASSGAPDESAPKHVLAGHDKPVLAVAFSRDGSRLATGAENGLTRIWDTKDGEPVLDLQIMWSVNAIGFTRDGKSLVTGTWGAQIWDVEEGIRKNHLEAHTGFLTSLAVSPDGKIVATGGLDSTVKIWDPRSWQELRSLTHRDQVNAIAFSDDSKTLTIAGDTSVAVWSAGDWKRVCELRDLKATAVALDADGKGLFVGCGDGTLRVFELPACREVRKASPHTMRITGLSLAQNGKRLAVSSTDQSAKLLSTEDLKVIGAWKHPDAVTAIAYSPDMKTIATGCKDGSARIWDVP